MDINQKLKHRRLEIGLTMLQVAKKVGVSEATISRWESGDIANMRRDKIVLLANALHVSPAYIMGDSELPYISYNTNTIGDKLRILRETFGFTQEELANKVQLSKPNICKYEKGTVEPNIETLLKFSELFNVSLDYLLCKTDIPNITNLETPNPILNKYNKLNTLGKTKAENYIDDLLENNKYTSQIIEMPREETYQVADPNKVSYKLVAKGGKVKETQPPIDEKTTL